MLKTISFLQFHFDVNATCLHSPPNSEYHNDIRFCCSDTIPLKSVLDWKIRITNNDNTRESHLRYCYLMMMMMLMLMVVLMMTQRGSEFCCHFVLHLVVSWLANAWNSINDLPMLLFVSHFQAVFRCVILDDHWPYINCFLHKQNQIARKNESCKMYRIFNWTLHSNLSCSTHSFYTFFL